MSFNTDARTVRDDRRTLDRRNSALISCVSRYRSLTRSDLEQTLAALNGATRLKDRPTTLRHFSTRSKRTVKQAILGSAVSTEPPSPC